MDSDIVPEGKWQFLVVAVHEDKSFLYQDGREVARTMMQKPVFDGQIRGLEIGAPSVGARPDAQFNGMLDEVMIWSRALPPDEIEQLCRRDGSAR